MSVYTLGLCRERPVQRIRDVSRPRLKESVTKDDAISLRKCGLRMIHKFNFTCLFSRASVGPELLRLISNDQTLSP